MRAVGPCSQLLPFPAQVIDNEPTKGEWGFKAHKQTLKVLFKQGRFSDMHATYRSLLTYIKSAVTRNYSEKSINSILDYVSAASDVSGAHPCTRAPTHTHFLPLVAAADRYEKRPALRLRRTSPSLALPPTHTHTLGPKVRPAAAVLRDDARGAARGKERPAVVQDQPQARQDVPRPRGLRQAGQDAQGAPPRLPNRRG